jgi:pyruvate formate lyase activating enzyme
MADPVCAVCGQVRPGTSEALGVCPACARTEAGQVAAMAFHARARGLFGLPGAPPRTEGGARCELCVHECSIGNGERGFCGLRTAHDGKLVHLGGTPERGVLGWYRDPLPTNCVADGLCGGGRKTGRHNLAVYYRSCSFDCLFCQNWSFRQTSLERAAGTSAEELAALARWDTHCVCYFGGDASTQMPHALAAAERFAERGVVVCWETSGAASTDLMDRAVDLSLRTGGCVKIDLKAVTDPLHVALTGASNRRTLENLARAAARIGERPEPPLLVVSTLLVPGYVDVEEVTRIARFLAGLDPSIPYVLLAFSPQFAFGDLPPTSRRHAEEACRAALDAGLVNVRVANQRLLREEE